VRYFFGGFEMIPNALMAVNVLTMSASVSGCIIGASGYRATLMRCFAAGIGIFWILLSGKAIYEGLERMEFYTAGGGELLLWIAGPSALGVQVLFGITGLQLGRAHLKLYLLPFEIAPTRSVVSLMIFMPFILLAGGIGTMLYGFPVVLLVVIVAMLRYDRPWRPRRERHPGTPDGHSPGWTTKPLP
jgi:hypothetical protein